MVVSDIDQLWVADITYIRLQNEFVYLGVVIDAYSRRVIGWALDRTVEDDLPLARCGARWNCGGPHLGGRITPIPAASMPLAITRSC
jgi:hypothetical protein